MGDSNKIVANLSQAHTSLREIRRDLNNSDLRSAYVTTNDVKTELLAVINFMDQITRFRTRVLDLNSSQSENIQTLADLSYKSLYKAREQLNDLKQLGDLDDNLFPTGFEDLSSDFNSLVDIYSSTISSGSLNFGKLNSPDVSLLRFDSEESMWDLANVHRNLVVGAVMNLTDPLMLRSEKPNLVNYVFDQYGASANFLPDLFRYKKSLKIYSLHLAELNLQLQDEVNAIYNDLPKVQSDYVFKKQDPLSKFINSIKNVKPVNIPFFENEIYQAVINDNQYKYWLQQLIQTSLDYGNKANLSDLVKTILILYGLRSKYESQNAILETEQIEKSNLLIANDAVLNPKVAILEKTLAQAKKFLENDPAVSELLEFTQNLADDSSVNSLIKRLANEFNYYGVASAFENSKSQIAKFYRTYKSIFIKSNIDQERLIKLDKAKTNAELISIFTDIHHSALRYNPINQLAAAKLIYIMSRAFNVNEARSDFGESHLSLLGTIWLNISIFLNRTKMVFKSKNTPLH